MGQDGTQVEAPAEGVTEGAQPGELQTPFGAFAFTFTDEDGTEYQGAAAIQKTLALLSTSGCNGVDCGCGTASDSPPQGQ
jgi:hypothetical protein